MVPIQFPMKSGAIDKRVCDTRYVDHVLNVAN